MDNKPRSVLVYRTREGQLPFAEWLRDLRDQDAVARVLARIGRVRQGNMGDCKPVGEGVSELRADYILYHKPGEDYTRTQVRKKFALMDEFINQWSSAEKKCAIIYQLEQQGIPLEALEKAVGRDYDPFDLILHVAYDQPPLTRKERANRVRKTNYFERFGPKARAVMEALLDKYADQGLESLESPEVLKVIPFPQMGTPVELIHAFRAGQASEGGDS